MGPGAGRDAGEGRSGITGAKTRLGATRRPPLRASTSHHLLGKVRRGSETASASILGTSGPSGPVEIQTFTQILRAGNIAKPNKYASPVMGSGADSPCQGEMARRARGGRVGDYEHEVLIWSRPRWRFAQSLVAPGEDQRSGFAGKRRSKGTNAVFAARRKRSGVDFATTSRRGQSNPPPAGGGISSATNKIALSSSPHPSRLRRATFPQGGRLKEVGGEILLQKIKSRKG